MILSARIFPVHQSQVYTEELDRKGVSGDEFFENIGLRVLLALRRINRAVDVHSRKLYQQLRITAPQMMCLYAIERSGALTLTALARSVALGPSTINGIIDRLEARGLVARRRSREDRRKVFVELSPSGHDLTHEAPSLIQDRFNAALRGLPAREQAAIARSLERIVDLMGAAEFTETPGYPADASDAPKHLKKGTST
jgi:DNA-binding MarR family transcriptional regulator